MKDPGLTIRTTYYTLLNNVVQHHSSGVPYFDQVPSGAGYPYMYMSGFTSNEDAGADKDVFCLDCTITILCCMKYPFNSGGFADVDGIANQVVDIIRGKQSSKFSYLILARLATCDLFACKQQFHENRGNRWHYLFKDTKIQTQDIPIMSYKL